MTEEVAAAFSEIAGGAHKTNDLVAEIAAASNEQSQGIDQINSGVEQLNQVTQQTATNAEESSSAAEELSAQAIELQTMVRQFVLNDGHRGYAAGDANAEEKKEKGLDVKALPKNGTPERLPSPSARTCWLPPCGKNWTSE